jgi:hypothetical protein
VQAIGGRTITNHPEVIGPEERRERNSPEGKGLLDAPLGLASSSAVEAGSLRVLSAAIVAHGHRLGTLRLAEPLTAVDQAKSSLRRTFVVVGLLALGGRQARTRALLGPHRQRVRRRTVALLNTRNSAHAPRPDDRSHRRSRSRSRRRCHAGFRLPSLVRRASSAETRSWTQLSS